jgi:hypothetical protein
MILFITNGMFRSLEMNQFSRIIFLKVELAGIQSIGNKLNYNFLVWLYIKLIS